ncbi:MAG: DNA repair protein RecN, partial [Cyanobacteriota bacterium]
PAAAHPHSRGPRLVVGGHPPPGGPPGGPPRARQSELAELAGGDSGEARSYAASLLDRAS